MLTAKTLTKAESLISSRKNTEVPGVSFTGLFDFFVHAFGTPWLKWWEAGRPETEEGLNYKTQERKNWDLTHPANLKQLACLRFQTLRSIFKHHRVISGSKGAVSIFVG